MGAALSVNPKVTYDPSMDRSSPSAAESASEVSAALDPRAAEVYADIYGLIVREIPQLRSDKRVTRTELDVQSDRHQQVLEPAAVRGLEQPGEAVADHRAAAMAHVHRPGRIGRDIFDVDGAALAHGGAALPGVAEHLEIGAAHVQAEALLVDVGVVEVSRGVEVDLEMLWRRAARQPRLLSRQGALGRHPRAHRRAGRLDRACSFECARACSRKSARMRRRGEE